MIRRIALTPGEPAGIGPDLAIMLAQHSRDYELVAIADPELLETRAKRLALPLQLRSYSSDTKPVADSAGTLCISEHSAQAEVQAGQLNAENSRYVLNTLDDAIAGCIAGDYSAMVTGPVHKGVINDAGIPFTGHTEYIAAAAGGYPVMMLLTEGLRVALATTHIPVAKIAQTISATLLKDVLTVLHADLQEKFGIADPQILVCGLNPHAGESGHLGTEEIDTIIPVLEELRNKKMSLTGPLPADTLFTPTHLKKADAVLAMYHDQGLPVLKYAGFGQAVNLTLGLPIIRTSVDHGTALDLAGKGHINSGSLNAALTLARFLCNNPYSTKGSTLS